MMAQPAWGEQSFPVHTSCTQQQAEPVPTRVRAAKSPVTASLPAGSDQNRLTQ